MTDSELTYFLFQWTYLEVAARHAGDYRTAVRYRKSARQVGRIIRYRVSEGTWGNGLAHPQNDEPSSP